MLALVPIDRIDLMGADPAGLSVGFGALGPAAWVAPATILILLCSAWRRACVRGHHAAAVVAGWDGLLPRGSRASTRYNAGESIVFVAS